MNSRGKPPSNSNSLGNVLYAPSRIRTFISTTLLRLRIIYPIFKNGLMPKGKSESTYPMLHFISKLAVCVVLMYDGAVVNDRFF